MADRLEQFLSGLRKTPYAHADLDSWAAAMAALVALVRQSLRTDIAHGDIADVETEHAMSEPDFGAYKLRSLRLQFRNGDAIELVPRGGQIVGSVRNGKNVSNLRGRADLIHQPSSRILPLYLANLNGALEWFIVDSDAESGRQELTGSALREAIVSLLGAGAAH